MAKGALTRFLFGADPGIDAAIHYAQRKFTVAQDQSVEGADVKVRAKADSGAIAGRHDPIAAKFAGRG